MLNRRFLRIKVMQALYACIQQNQSQNTVFEKNLFHSIDNVQKLYVYVLQLLLELKFQAERQLEEQRVKLRPSTEDLNPSLRFIQNHVLAAIEQITTFQNAKKKYGISWQPYTDLVRQLWSRLKQEPVYLSYMQLPDRGYRGDAVFIQEVLQQFLFEQELLTAHFSELDLHWTDDVFMVFTTLVKHLEQHTEAFEMRPLWHDEDDDLKFVKTLFNFTLQHKSTFSADIQRFAQNWELERIAQMDLLLMQMALTEILYLPEIPVKATLNEYIEISKQYSTPGSKLFINGILDKLVNELKSNNQIHKSGKGLKEI